MILALYRALSYLAFVIAWPLLAVLARLRPERWRSRLGEGALARGAVWIHAASVGEVLGAQPLIDGIAAARPALPILLTTMTPTGLRVARDLSLPVAGASLAPLDFPQSIARFLAAASPSAIVLVETELWPNLLDAARRRGVALALVNARISDRSAARYRALRGLFRRALSGAAWIAAQTPADRARFITLGARPERVDVVGSMKGDARAAGASRDDARAAVGARDEDRVVLFGSARSVEDDAFLRVASRLTSAEPALRIVYAPRHPERVAALLTRLATAGIGARSLTEWRSNGGDWRFLVVDTLGELRSLYAAADVAVVGGSFSRHGGHNPLEAARCGVPVIMGPHRDNVKESFARIESAGGAEGVADEDGLALAIERLLRDPDERARRGDRARAACDAASPVAERVLAGLETAGLLPPATPLGFGATGRRERAR